MFRGMFLILVILSLSSVYGSRVPRQGHEGEFVGETIEELKGIDENQIEIKCGLDGIHINIPTPHPYFSGMIYPLGLSKNSSCLAEYDGITSTSIQYRLPLRACNTMKNMEEQGTGSTEEFYNTIVLEPHPKLMTGKGKGFHIRCKYANSADAKTNPDKSERVSMRIKTHPKNPQDSTTTTNLADKEKKFVQIGDQIEIEIEPEDARHPFIVTDCKVRDGLGWAEETLLNKDGCPTDPEIFGEFNYESSLGDDETGSQKRRRAHVKFLAHKFPYSPSVYYSCAVRFCKDSSSKACLPPDCDVNGRNQNIPRGKRETFLGDDSPATIEVYNGILVEENPSGIDNADSESSNRSDNALCFKKRDFALAIAFSGLFLMIAVIVLLFALCLRRRNVARKGSSIDGSGSSSIYSTVGGYTNTAYSHSS